MAHGDEKVKKWDTMTWLEIRRGRVFVLLFQRLCSSSSITIRLWPQTGWTPQGIRLPSASRTFRTAGLQNASVLNP
jgi:hypothetical protein